MNIEELARDADLDWKKGFDLDGINRYERFAALVLEQAAQKCDDGSIEGEMFAKAIRAMKPNTPISGVTSAA